MSKTKWALTFSISIFILSLFTTYFFSESQRITVTNATSTAAHPSQIQSTIFQTTSIPYVKIKDFVFYVEVAKTDLERGRGLSGRPSLPDNAGMLFVFEEPAKYGFWMFEMRFSIDIIWLDESKRVVYIVEKAEPCTLTSVCPVFVPEKEAKYVLEINAGVCEKLGLKVGDVVEFSPGLTD